MAVKSEVMTIEREDGSHTFTAVQLPPTRALKLINRLSDLGMLSGADAAKRGTAVLAIVGTDVFDTLLATVTVTMNGRNAPMSQALFDGEFAGHLGQAIEFLAFAIKVQISDFLVDNQGGGSPA